MKIQNEATNSPMILILGANGKTGKRVVNRLTELGIKTRKASRSTPIPFEWNDEGTWSKVLEGMESVYLTYQPDLAVPGAVATIKAFTQKAIETGIKKIVLLSGRGEKEAQDCEQIVMNSGVNWSIVRCSWFSQNFSESFFLEPILAGHIALPRAEALEPYTDADDIADVVVETLIDPQHYGKLYELTGPRLLSFEQVVNEIATATGRELHFQPISMNAYKAQMKELHIPNDYIWLVEYLFTEVLDGRNSSITNDIELVLGRKPKDFSTYVEETAATGVWNVKEVVA